MSVTIFVGVTQQCYRTKTGIGRGVHLVGHLRFIETRACVHVSGSVTARFNILVHCGVTVGVNGAHVVHTSTVTASGVYNKLDNVASLGGHICTIHSAGHSGRVGESAGTTQTRGSGTVVVTGLHRIPHSGVTSGRVVVGSAGSGCTISVVRA